MIDAPQHEPSLVQQMVDAVGYANPSPELLDLWEEIGDKAWRSCREPLPMAALLDDCDPKGAATMIVRAGWLVLGLTLEKHRDHAQRAIDAWKCWADGKVTDAERDAACLAAFKATLRPTSTAADVAAHVATQDCAAGAVINMLSASAYSIGPRRDLADYIGVTVSCPTRAALEEACVRRRTSGQVAWGAAEDHHG